MRYNNELTSDLARQRFLGSDKENKRLYPLVVNGDKQARQDMVNNNIPLALLIVKNLFKRQPQLEHLQDDLTAGAFLLLVESIDTLARQDKPTVKEPSGYIVQSISHGLRHIVEHSPLVRVPRKNPTQPLTRVYCDLNQVATNNSNTFELDDLIDSCCETCLEFELIALREQGLSFKKIVDQLKTSSSTLRRVLCSIQKRVLKKLAE